MCRRSELVALQFEDLSVESDGFGTVLIRRSKGDQEGVGAIAPIPGDALRHVQAWIDAARISGHSPRVGCAQDLLRFGESLPSIMAAGRWQNAEMISRYTRKQGARQSAAVRVAERRVQF